MTDPSEPRSTQPAPAPESTTAPAPKKSRIWRILGISALVLVLLIALLPTIVSMFFLRSNAESALEKALGTDVQLASSSVGWMDGVHVTGLVVQNPDGFERSLPAIKLAELNGDMSFVQLLRGRFDLVGKVDGLEIRVVQNRDGTINLAKLGSGTATEAEEEPETPTEESSGDSSSLLKKLRLDLVLSNALIEVTSEATGAIETISALNAKIVKPFGGTDVKLELGADIGGAQVTQKGRIDMDVDVDASFARPAQLNLDLKGIDISRYEEFVQNMMPDQVDALAGKIEGEIHATAHPEQNIDIGGELRIVEPRLAGALFAGLDVRAPQWTIKPAVSADMSGGGTPKIDMSGMNVDLGFLHAQGLAAEPTAALCGGAGFGLGFDVDLGMLASFGGPIPKDLDASGAKTKGSVALRAPDGKLEFESVDALLGMVGAKIDLTAPRLAYGKRILSDFGLAIGVQQGKLDVRTNETAKLDGGALKLLVTGDLQKLSETPFEFQASIDGAAVAGGAVESLRFAVPLLAGIAPEAAGIDFKSNLKFNISGKGPALPTDEQDVIDWLSQWSGDGTLALHQGSFTPAPVMTQLLEFLGERGQMTFDDLTTSFRIDKGAIANDALKFISKGREYGLSGTTTLRGGLDYSLDVAALLRGHRDGEKILKYVDPSVIGAGIQGTLDSPQLKLPRIDELLKSAAQGALQGAVQKEANKHLDPLREKAEKALGEGASDLIKKGLGGLFGGKKKKKD